MRLKRRLKDARFLGENLYESERLHTPFVPGGGIYAENYRGSYELRTLDVKGKVLDTKKLGG